MIYEQSRSQAHGSRQIHVCTQVTLLGTFRSTPTHAGPWDRGHGPPGNLTGSVLECYGGKGNANGTAFITLNSDSTLEGVVIFYPEQVLSGTYVHALHVSIPVC